MSTLIFLDTETTGLSLDDDIWEFAAIRRNGDGKQTEHHLFIDHALAKCSQLPESFLDDHHRRFPAPASGRVARREVAAGVIAALMADRPHVVGAVPNFDTERLARLLAEFGHEPTWHYHLIDVENLAVGYLSALPWWRFIKRRRARNARALPWKSDELSRACGVEPPGDGERHTAMGDARWAMRLYDAITGGVS